MKKELLFSQSTANTSSSLFIQILPICSDVYSLNVPIITERIQEYLKICMRKPGSFAYKNTGFEVSVSILEQISILTVTYFQGF